VNSPRRSIAPSSLLPDTQPGGLTSQPDMGLWTDSDVGLPHGPARVFATNQASANEKEMPTIGHIGRYALKYRIGAGGLGTVYAAHDPLLSRLVAIKTLNLELSPDERQSFNALFLDEARAAGGLSHPHIVTVFDAGVSDDSAYIAMEMLKGRDLRQLRQEGWRPTPAQAALIVRRVADALAYAHSKGVVHRDVKPANIFMVGRTQPRVLDFGIARVAHRHDVGADDIAAGSPYYMAPEQARNQIVDRRADVFSLGVVLYELLTDRKPFRGSTLGEITQAVLTLDPPLASEVDRKVPLGLAEIAAHAMHKDPEQRYRSARAFSRDLRHWLDDNAATQDGELPSATPATTRTKWIRAGLAATLIGALALAAAWLPRGKPAEVAMAPVAPAPAARVALSTPAPVPVTSPAPALAATPTVGVSNATGAKTTPAAATTITPSPTTLAAPAVATAATALPAANKPVASDVVTNNNSGSTTPAPTTPAAAAAPPKTSSAGANGTAAKPPVAKPVPPKPTAAAAKPAVPPKPADRPAAKPAAVAKAPPAAANRRAADAAAASDAKAATTAGAAAAATSGATAAGNAASKVNGTLRIAISPWGQVEVNGVPAGTAPPLNQLTLPEGRHQIVIRNGDFPPFRGTVNVTAGQVVSLKHRFGS
jgi:eukaryotic-like serine/threonine-protein kinase